MSAHASILEVCSTNKDTSEPPELHLDTNSHVHSQSVIYVEFAQEDQSDPLHFPQNKKWVITALAVIFTGFSASASSSFALGNPSMIQDLKPSSVQVNLALSVYALGFGIVPLVTASFSEEFGRRPLYVASALLFFSMHIGIALARDITEVIVFRFLLGAAGSTGATMVGGTVSDIWAPHERGVPMSFFSLAAIGATGLGPVAAGWIQENHHLRWRWIQWVHAISSGIYLFLVLAFMSETRAGVLLTKRARKLRKETGDMKYRARVENERESLKTLIWISCTRPLHLLFTEPIVASFSLWIAFAWGIVYGQIESIGLVFRSLYDFDQGQVGLAFLPLFLGAFLAFLTNFYQETLYRRNAAKRGPEARLYAVLVAGFLFPMGCFIYAWTSYPSVSFIGPCIGLTVFMFSVYIMYQAVFSYLADCYQIYASSALAGQSLCRNLSATAFPLFSNAMYTKLTFKWASTLLGCIALAMSPIPIILFVWGPSIRARSGFAKKLETWRETLLAREAGLSKHSEDGSLRGTYT